VHIESSSDVDNTSQSMREIENCKIVFNVKQNESTKHGMSHPRTKLEFDEVPLKD
jgi:hypothetical protein